MLAFSTQQQQLWLANLQAKVHSSVTTLDSSHDIAAMPQLSRLHEAVCSASDGCEAASIADILQVLTGLCHPDSTQRMNAVQTVAIEWLRMAAAKPFPRCPATALFS